MKTISSASMLYKCAHYAFAFLLLTSIAIAQNTKENKLTMKFEGIPLKDALKKIETATDLQFVFVEEEIQGALAINKQYESKSVDFILNDILASNKLGFKQVGNNIAIQKITKKDEDKGKLTGKLKDEASGEPLIGAIIMADNGKATQADLNGNFSLELPSGTYTITIKYTGYKNKVINNVKIEGGKATKLPEVSMQTDTKELGEVNVSGTKTTNTNNALILEMKDAKSIISGISAEQIGRSQDRDAAEVVRRVSGVSVIQDRFIVIRGLPQRYNTVMLNNAVAPSFENNSRAFTFDIIPSAMIDRIIVHKTATPDLPGDFAGGLVKVYTTGMPAQNSFHVSYQTSYRPNTHFRPFYEQPQGKYAWLGYDDGTYALPKGTPGVVDFRGDKAFTESLNKNWQAEKGNAPLDQRLILDVARKIKLGNSITVGLVAAGGYYSKKQYTVRSRNLIQQGTPTFLLIDQVYTHSTQLNGLANLSIDYKGKHRIDFKNLYSHLGTFRYQNTFGNAGDGVPNATDEYAPRQEVRQTALSNDFKTIYTGQLNGKHEFFDRWTKLTWMGGYTESEFNLPDWRIVGGSIYGAVEGTVGRSANWARYYQNLPEKTKTASIDIEQKLTNGSFQSSFKAGVFLEDKARDFTLRHFNRIPSLDGKDIVLGENFQTYNSYMAANNLLAFYASAEIGFLGFKLNGGLRREHNKQTLSGFPYEYYWPELSDSAGFLSVNNDITSLLPSGNLSYNINERTLVRVAASKTLNRVEFREIFNSKYWDPENFTVTYGNPGMKPQSDIYNYDLRFEHYPGVGEFFNIGIFYKYFKYPIEYYFNQDTGGYNSIRFGNADHATCYGAEIEWYLALKRFFKGEDRYSRILQNITLLSNAAYIYSEVFLSTTGSTGGLIFQSAKRPLFGQSPYTINAQINYTVDKLGLKLNLSYNTIGQRLLRVGTPLGSPDIYETPRHSLDFTFSQRILKYVEINGGIQNILDSRFVQLQDTNGDGVLNRDAPINNPGLDNRFLSYYGGTYYTLGMGVRF